MCWGPSCPPPGGLRVPWLGRQVRPARTRTSALGACRWQDPTAPPAVVRSAAVRREVSIYLRGLCCQFGVGCAGPRPPIGQEAGACPRPPPPVLGPHSLLSPLTLLCVCFRCLLHFFQSLQLCLPCRVMWTSSGLVISFK